AQIRPFREVLKLWQEAGDDAKRQGKPDALFLETSAEAFRKYTDLMQSSYRKPWPRPWPCGTVWLHWDSRMVRVLRQELDISTGVATLELQHDNLRGDVRTIRFTCFVSRANGPV